LAATLIGSGENMKEITMSPCPHCGNTQIDYWDETDGFYYCEKCGLCGPRAHDKILAADRWNGMPRHLKWTKEKPTKDGYYWYKDKITMQMIAFVDASTEAVEFFVFPEETCLDALDGEWAGPIQEPMEADQ